MGGAVSDRACKGDRLCIGLLTNAGVFEGSVCGGAGREFFKAIPEVNPVYRFPHVSLLSLGVVAAAFCFLRLRDAIAALVVIRLILQFLVQAIGLMVF